MERNIKAEGANLMNKLHDLLNWKLESGSHEFPGPSGGTCINEAAIVASGFEYRSVKSLEDLPPCFSPVLGACLLEMNDEMPDPARQLLMDFVLKLSGSADLNEVEQKRLEFLIASFIKQYITTSQCIIDVLSFYPPEKALAFRAALGEATTLSEIKSILINFNTKYSNDFSEKIVVSPDFKLTLSDFKLTISRIERINNLLHRIKNSNIKKESYVLNLLTLLFVQVVSEISFEFMGEYSILRECSVKYFIPYIEIIDEAFNIGNKSTELEVEQVKTRFDKIKESV